MIFPHSNESETGSLKNIGTFLVRISTISFFLFGIVGTLSLNGLMPFMSSQPLNLLWLFGTLFGLLVAIMIGRRLKTYGTLKDPDAEKRSVLEQIGRGIIWFSFLFMLLPFASPYGAFIFFDILRLGAGIAFVGLLVSALGYMKRTKRI